MLKHASESYFVLGEGLLSISEGGRRVAVDGPPFRFSRIGPRADDEQLADEDLAALAAAMTQGGGGVGRYPAGFTYLGQFIDHDMTFDRLAEESFGEPVSEDELLQARSPALDLDALYGNGPRDPNVAGCYAGDAVHLEVGATAADGGVPALPGHDLARAGDRPLIPDTRNDENLAVAQTHLAFIRFHNRVVDQLPASVPPRRRFRAARELVTKHYQWLIATDYLPRVCEPAVVQDVFAHGRRAFEPEARPGDLPTMPIEFSVAAFRFGHSTIRRGYSWNRFFDDGAGTLDLLFELTSAGGIERLPSRAVADFRRLYEFEPPDPKLNLAMRADTALVVPLHELPAEVFQEPQPPLDRNLAFRDLMRAKMLGLATGQLMAERLGVPPLDAAAIRDGDRGARLDNLTAQQQAAVVTHTPLWFYVLREAELNGGVLDGVGARIVAETFHRAIEGSRISILRDRDWRPLLGPDGQTFRMVDLLRYAFDGDLSPFG